MTTLQSEPFWASITVPLTAAQRTAIAHVDGPLLVVAGPGSGKTTVITYRAAYLTKVAGVDPASLLVVTFTKAAADAMKARTARVAGAAVASRGTFGTFHALAYRMLRQADPGRRIKLLEEGEQLGLVRQLMQQVGLNTDDETVMDAVGEISRMRASTDRVAAFNPRGMTKTDFRRLYEGYQEAKAERGALDFDDLLHEALGQLQSNPDMLAWYRNRYRHIMVDEFQDTNPVQWELVRILAAPLNNLCVVGDDDQAIYGWRGATPDFLLGFPQAFPQAVRVTLDQNHRCPPAVVQASNRLAAHNQHRFGKVVKATRSGGAPISLMSPADSLLEAEEIVQLIRRTPGSLESWAVVYRTNQQGHTVAQVLSRAGLPYRVLGGLPNLYRRWPVQDVLSYLRAATGDLGAIEPVINRPTRYISRAVMQEAKAIAGRTGLDVLSAIAQTGLLRSWQLRPIEELIDHLLRLSTLPAPDAIGYVRTVIGYDDYIREYCTREGGSADEMLGLLSEVQRTTPAMPVLQFLAHVDSFSARSGQAAEDGESAVTLVTCHKAKGLEFPHVVVIGAIDKLMPHRGAEDLEEERRLMYVAMTRAKERLWVSSPGAYEGRECQPSPFIGEALGPEAEAFLAQRRAAEPAPAPAPAPAPVVTPAPAPEPVIRAVPKPAPKAKKAGRKVYIEPAESDLPPLLEPGTRVFHERHGSGLIESIDPTLRRVIIDFSGNRLSLDLAWCLGSPQFFRVETGD